MSDVRGSRRDTLKKIAALALPAVFENVMMTLAGIVDVAMVGSLGAEATASAALNAPALWLSNGVATLAAGGSAVLVARSWGAGDYAASRRYACQSALLSLVLGACLAVAALSLGDVYARWMNAARDVAPGAAAYMRIVGSSMPFFVLSRTFAGVLQGSGDTVTPMKTSLLSNLLNVIGNYLLIYPTHAVTIGGFSLTAPGAGMGVRGAALSTAASYAFAALALSASLALKRSPLRLGRGSSFAPSRAELGQILRISLPIAGERIAISSGQLLFVSVVSTLGTVSVSAHYLATTAEGVCYNPAYGIAAAATALVGQALGAGDERTAQRYAHTCAGFCVCVMAVVSTGMFFGANLMISLFSRETAVVELGAMALRIVAFAEIPFGMALTYSASLRSAGDGAVPLAVGLVTMWAVRQCAARLFVLAWDLGLAGAWYAMVLDVTLRGLLLWGYFVTGRWKRTSRRLAAETSR